jgi:hypothetical protein
MAGGVGCGAVVTVGGAGWACALSVIVRALRSAAETEGIIVSLAERIG